MTDTTGPAMTGVFGTTVPFRALVAELNVPDRHGYVLPFNPLIDALPDCAERPLELKWLPDDLCAGKEETTTDLGGIVTRMFTTVVAGVIHLHAEGHASGAAAAALAAGERLMVGPDIASSGGFQPMLTTAGTVVKARTGWNLRSLSCWRTGPPAYERARMWAVADAHAPRTTPAADRMDFGGWYRERTDFTWMGLPLLGVTLNSEGDIFNGHVCAGGDPEVITAYFGRYQGEYQVIPEPGHPGRTTIVPSFRRALELARQWYEKGTS